MNNLKDVFIIDDDAIAVFGLKRSMESIDISENILTFENGLDALENIEQRLKDGSALPSLIFLDLNMPVMGGWEFLGNFFKAYPPEKVMPHIFIMTSSIDFREVERAKTYNLESNYLIKPVTSDVLKRILP